MNFLMTDNKSLICRGIKRPVYKYETGVENIKFLIPKKIGDVDLTETECIVECVLPEENLFKVFHYDEELYKDMLTVTVPITSTITKSVGANEVVDIKVYLMFLKVNENDASIADEVLKSNVGIFQVMSTWSYDGESEEAFDEVWHHSALDALQEQVDNLEKDHDELEDKVSGLSNDKADSVIINPDTNQVELKSGDKILSSATVPDQVIWEERD